MTKGDFILSKKNCTGIQEMIENGRPKTVEVEGIRCVISKNDGDTTRKYKPVIPFSILHNYAISLHLDMHTDHQSPAAIIRKIKQHFFILDEGVVKKALGGCYLCQISTPITDTRQQYSLHQLPEKPRLHLAFDVCGAVNEDTPSFKYIFLCIDLFSNYVLGSASKNRTAREIINFLRLAVLNYGMIRKLTVDGENSLLQN